MYLDMLCIHVCTEISLPKTELEIITFACSILVHTVLICCSSTTGLPWFAMLYWALALLYFLLPHEPGLNFCYCIYTIWLWCMLLYITMHFENSLSSWLTCTIRNPCSTVAIWDLSCFVKLHHTLVIVLNSWIHAAAFVWTSLYLCSYCLF